MMASLGSKFFYIKDEKVYLKAKYMELYIPEEYKTKKLLLEYGRNVHVFGLLGFRIGESEPKDKILSGKIYTLNIPSMIMTKPTMVSAAGFDLKGGDDIQKYIVYKYFKDDAVIESDSIIKGLENVNAYLDLESTGSIPPNLKYGDIVKPRINNMGMNSIHLNVPITVMSARMSAICRSAKDPNIPYRHEYNKTKDEYGYVALNMRNIAMFSSTLSAVTFEDPNTMIATAINNTRHNKKQDISPIEKTIKY